MSKLRNLLCLALMCVLSGVSSFDAGPDVSLVRMARDIGHVKGGKDTGDHGHVIIKAKRGNAGDQAKKRERKTSANKRNGDKKRNTKKSTKSTSSKRSRNKKKKSIKKEKKGNDNKKKETKKSTKKNSKTGTRQSCDSCNSGLVNLTATLAQAGRSVERLAARAINSAAITATKLAKKDVFAGPAALAVGATGGNSNNLQCPKNQTSVVAPTVNTLKNCSTAIQDACAPLANSSVTVANNCANAVSAFRTAVLALSTLTNTSAICAGVASAISLQAPVLACASTVSAASSAQQALRAQCLRVFGACRAAERNVAGIINSCNLPCSTTSSGGSSSLSSAGRTNRDQVDSGFF